MTTRGLAMTTAGVVAVAASVAAGLTTWLLITAPTTVAMAIEGRDAEPLLQVALSILHDALTRLVRFF
jgi:cytochrome c biogenesis factor